MFYHVKIACYHESHTLGHPCLDIDKNPDAGPGVKPSCLINGTEDDHGIGRSSQAYE